MFRPKTITPSKITSFPKDLSKVRCVMVLAQANFSEKKASKAYRITSATWAACLRDAWTQVKLDSIEVTLRIVKKLIEAKAKAAKDLAVLKKADWVLTGDTYPVKEVIKAAGGIYIESKKAWAVSQSTVDIVYKKLPARLWNALDQEEPARFYA